MALKGRCNIIRDIVDIDLLTLMLYLYFILGPTLKLRRPIVNKMFKDEIDGFYEEA